MADPSRRERRPVPPLDAAALDRLALRYVERFATTRGKLTDYLRRKVRERGWDGPPVDPRGVAERMVALGYVDDRAFAEARAGAMQRRGLGERRVRMAFRAAGIEEDDVTAVADGLADGALDAALAFARRKRIGPFAREPAERDLREKQLAAMVRAGHSFTLARRIVTLAPGDQVDEELTSLVRCDGEEPC